MKPPAFKRQWTTADGTIVTIRPIRPDDRELELEFVRGLSSDSRYFRFMAFLKELSPQMLERFINVDYPREMALIATVPIPGGEREIGVARYASDSESGETEFAIVVADAWQGAGIGRELLRQLFDVARGAGIEHLAGFVLKANRKMLELARELGFTVSQVPGEAQLVRVSKVL